MFQNNFEKILDNSFVRNEVVDVTYINKKHKNIGNTINHFVL